MNSPHSVHSVKERHTKVILISSLSFIQRHSSQRSHPSLLKPSERWWMMQSSRTCGHPVCVSTSLCSFPKGRQVVSNDNQVPSTVFSPTKPEDSAQSGCYGAFARPRGAVCKPKLLALNWGLTGHGGGCQDPAGQASAHRCSQLFLSCAFWGP